MAEVSAIATLTRVHGSGKHEPRWVGQAHGRPVYRFGRGTPHGVGHHRLPDAIHREPVSLAPPVPPVASTGTMMQIWLDVPPQRTGESRRGLPPVQTPVLDGFADVRAGQLVSAGQVGNGACDLEDAVVSPGRQPEP